MTEPTPKESWLDSSASRIPFPSKAKAREFLIEVTEGWGFAAITLEAKGERGYVLLPPEHFEKLLNLWRHVWNDPLGRQTKVLIEPGTRSMAFTEVGAKAGFWGNVLSGVAVLVIVAIAASEINSFANEKVQDAQIADMRKQIDSLTTRIRSLEGGHPK